MKSDRNEAEKKASSQCVCPGQTILNRNALRLSNAFLDRIYRFGYTICPVHPFMTFEI